MTTDRIQLIYILNFLRDKAGFFRRQHEECLSQATELASKGDYFGAYVRANNDSDAIATELEIIYENVEKKLGEEIISELRKDAASVSNK